MQDSTAIWIALIGAGSSIVASAASVIVGLKTHGRISEVEHNTNSIKDELVKVTGQAEHAKGMLQGAAEQVAKSSQEEDNLP